MRRTFSDVILCVHLRCSVTLSGCSICSEIRPGTAADSARASVDTMAVPQQMEREAPTLAPLLQGATGIKFGPAEFDPHTYFDGQGPGKWPGWPSKGLSGSTPVTDLEGKKIATLKFSTNNTFQGQMSAQVVLPDGSIWVQIERAKTTQTWGRRRGRGKRRRRRRGWRWRRGWRGEGGGRAGSKVCAM